MNMNRLFTLLFVFSCTSLFSQGWNLNTETTSVERFKAICASDTDHIWIAGSIGESPNLNAYITHSSDGGQSWNEQETEMSYPLVDIFFMDQDTGWAIGYTILKTTDGGMTWLEMDVDSFPSNPAFVSMDMIGIYGYAVGDGGSMIKTEDYGSTWDSLAFDESLSGAFYLDIGFFDEDIGLVAGGNGTDHQIMRTINGGENWSEANIDSEVIDQGRINDLFVVNDSTVYACGSFGKVLRSDDLGSNWYGVTPVQDLFGSYELHSSYFLNPDTGWVVGTPLSGGPSFARVFVTLDGGNSWYLQFNYQNSTSQVFNDIIFTENNVGWICGSQWGGQATNGGIIFESNGEITTSVNELKPSLIKDLLIWPNPVNDHAELQFELVKTTVISVGLFNNLGQKLSDIYSGRLAPGSQSFVLDLEDVRTGIYYIQISVDDELIHKKIIKVN